MLIWLPEQGFKHSDSSCQNMAYIPTRVLDKDSSYCYCGLLKESYSAKKVLSILFKKVNIVLLIFIKENLLI